MDIKSALIRIGNSRITTGPRTREIISAAFGAVLFLGACSTPVVTQSVSFNAADFESAEAAGTASISGHAFVRSDTGAKHGAAGLPICLVPLTAYTEERAKIMESGKDVAAPDPGLEKFTRTTVGDWGGGYKFEGLPAGKYLLYCKVTWEQRFAGSRLRDGSGDVYAVARVQIANGEHKNAVITNLAQK